MKKPQLAVLGAVLVAADLAFKTERKFEDDVRRDVLRGFDRRVHHVRRGARNVFTALEAVLIAVVLVMAVDGLRSGVGPSDQPAEDSGRPTGSTSV